jgi:hypothetical protein
MLAEKHALQISSLYILSVSLLAHGGMPEICARLVISLRREGSVMLKKSFMKILLFKFSVG